MENLRESSKMSVCEPHDMFLCLGIASTAQMDEQDITKRVR